MAAQPAAGPEAVAQRPPVPARQHGQRQRDAAGRDDVEVTLLGEPPRRVREGHRRDGGAGAARAELAHQGVAADEQQGVSQHEQDVVPQQRRHRAVAEHAGRRVTEEAVAVREAVPLGEERVGLPEAGRVGQQDVAGPRDLPGLAGRVPDVLRHGVQRITQGRPGEGDGQDQTGVRDQRVLVDEDAAQGLASAAEAAGGELRRGGEGGPRVGRGAGRAIGR
jgi:hypothetical protein